jgi:hypothetical protein
MTLRKTTLIVCAVLSVSPLLSSVASAGNFDWINNAADTRNAIGRGAEAAHKAGQVGESMGALDKNMKALGCYNYWGRKC